jgi:hypothetical protein
MQTHCSANQLTGGLDAHEIVASAVQLVQRGLRLRPKAWLLAVQPLSSCSLMLQLSGENDLQIHIGSIKLWESPIRLAQIEAYKRGTTSWGQSKENIPVSVTLRP